MRNINHSLWEENFSSGELTVTPEKLKYLLDQAQAESAACICGSLGQPLSLIRISINYVCACPRDQLLLKSAETFTLEVHCTI